VLITAGYQDSGTGPQTWVIASAGLAIGLGTYSGGWRIMRTMGKGIVDVHAPQGFAAETTLGHGMNHVAPFSRHNDGLELTKGSDR
jgi:phosphate/sulfate permease